MKKSTLALLALGIGAYWLWKKRQSALSGAPQDFPQGYLPLSTVAFASGSQGIVAAPALPIGAQFPDTGEGELALDQYGRPYWKRRLPYNDITLDSHWVDVSKGPGGAEWGTDVERDIQDKFLESQVGESGGIAAQQYMKTIGKEDDWAGLGALAEKYAQESYGGGGMTPPVAAGGAGGRLVISPSDHRHTPGGAPVAQMSAETFQALTQGARAAKAQSQSVMESLLNYSGMKSGLTPQQTAVEPRRVLPYPVEQTGGMTKEELAAQNLWFDAYPKWDAAHKERKKAEDAISDVLAGKEALTPEDILSVNVNRAIANRAWEREKLAADTMAQAMKVLRNDPGKQAQTNAALAETKKGKEQRVQRENRVVEIGLVEYTPYDVKYVGALRVVFEQKTGKTITSETSGRR
jgi:hypothetical protein